MGYRSMTRSPPRASDQPRHVLVPRFFDFGNTNAQNLNAKALLRRFRAPDIAWTGTYYSAPDPQIAARPSIRLVRLWRHRFWHVRMFLLYLNGTDAVFYPGVGEADRIGIRMRDVLRGRTPVVGTLEGLVGDAKREATLTEWAGHEVCCQRVSQRQFRRAEFILQRADHVIAISPFLAEMGRRLYGDKVSMIPLGIDTTMFFPSGIRRRRERQRVVCAGTVTAQKRPGFFVEIAGCFPQADFIWYGDGPMMDEVRGSAAAISARNVSFAGKASPETLGQEFRDADLFIMPSKAEGVPKVSQEAAACGLPQVIFGTYRSPSVIDGVNGYSVWSDEAFISRTADLLADDAKARRMGEAGATLAREWDWESVAPRWEEAVTRVVSQS